MTRIIEVTWECDCCGDRSKTLKDMFSAPVEWIEETINPNTYDVHSVHFCCEEHRDIFFDSRKEKEL